uniref:Uncharacterized protein n=1 Tax=Rhizophora mucronata TaxID=61149 RepID=A0A2P2N0C8_RHIMU
MQQMVMLQPKVHSDSQVFLKILKCAFLNKLQKHLKAYQQKHMCKHTLLIRRISHLTKATYTSLFEL